MASGIKAKKRAAPDAVRTSPRRKSKSKEAAVEIEIESSEEEETSTSLAIDDSTRRQSTKRNNPDGVRMRGAL